ncbi:MAG: hypothetical protein M3445_09675 [Actinomycetota bacterium]|nr:hypothetical protein [Actinomycetota bacterium]
MIEALGLSELLPPDAEALWLWWLACRRPDLVSPESYMQCEALPADVRAALSWIVDRGPSGVDAYASAYGAAQPYLRALRDLERAGRQYPALLEALAAVKGGAKDLNMVMGQLPGGWSAAALQGGRKKLVLEAFFTRDRAAAAGAPADLPALRLPRFTGVDEPFRSLCLDALGGLPGSTGVALDGSPPETLPLPEDVELGRRAVLSQQLRRRGLPVSEFPLDPSFWLHLLPHAGEDWLGELEGDGPGSAVVRALRRLLSCAVEAASLRRSLADCHGYWSTAQRDQAADVAVRTCLTHGRSAVAADLLDDLAADHPETVARHLDAALQDLSAPEVTLLAFNQRFHASVRQLAQLQESFA